MTFGRLSPVTAQPYGSGATLPVQLGLGLRSLSLVDSDAEMQQRLAYAIRAALAAKGWKPPDLARAIGVDASTTTRWADGISVPNLLMVGPMSKALGVKPEFLFNPPPVPNYPLSEYLVRQAAAEGVEEGIRRSQRQPRQRSARAAPEP